MRRNKKQRKSLHSNEKFWLPVWICTEDPSAYYRMLIGKFFTLQKVEVVGKNNVGSPG